MQNPRGDSSDSKPIISDNSNIESEICCFYEQVLKELYKASGQKFSDIRKSLTNIRSYKNPDIEEHDTVSFDEGADRLAYVFAYCVIHSIVMFDRLFGMLKANPSMLEKIISMKQIRLCVLGGGPGFEASTACKVLSTLVMHNNAVREQPLQIHVTIIDICAGWEKDAEFIMNSTQRNLCASSNVKIGFKFIVANLTNGFSEEVSKAMKKSHIVTMFKFLSDVNDSSYSKDEIPDMVYRIIDSMSFRACLFYLDNSGGSLFKNMDKMIDKLPFTYRIYGPCLHNCHTLNMDSVEYFSNALKSIFRFFKCTNRTKVSCSAWIKVRHILKVDEMTCDSGIASTDAILPECMEQKLKIKGPKKKIKKVLQSAPKLKELYCSSDSSSDSNDE